MPTIFIDGQEGTTGLQLQSRLESRPDLTLLAIDPALRKDPAARARRLNEADIAFLCLPDAAAREAAALVENPATCVIDASTAHRTTPGWAYGFPELSQAHRAAIKTARRIAVPGCYATGFLAIAYPLVALGLLDPATPLTCHGVSGYSGGGKRMIAEYEAENRSASFDSPRQYGLTLQHKHLPEMQAIPGLLAPPLFNPIVCDFYAGMAVTVPLHAAQLTRPLTADALREILQAYYTGEPFLSVQGPPEGGFLPANANTGTNRLTLHVSGSAETGQLTLTSVLDNLGKGSSGAAVQCMNLALGLDEFTI
jgi:N-acetyl-gamma-glutamyl-phosphate reductase